MGPRRPPSLLHTTIDGLLITMKCTLASITPRPWNCFREAKRQYSLRRVGQQVLWENRDRGPSRQGLSEWRLRGLCTQYRLTGRYFLKGIAVMIIGTLLVVSNNLVQTILSRMGIIGRLTLAWVA